jgi:hypothetical protein
VRSRFAAANPLRSLPSRAPATLNVEKEFLDLKDYADVSISRSLELRVNVNGELTTVRLDRIAAQHLAAAINAFSGPTAKGATLNAGKFTTVFATPVKEKAKAARVVRL